MRGTRCFTPTDLPMPSIALRCLPRRPILSWAGMHEIPDPRIQAACRQTPEMELSLSAA